MKFFKLIGVLLGALVLIGALAGSALAGAAKTGRSAVRTVVHFPANGPGGQASNTCFWGTSYTEETWNNIWPDSHTNYGLDRHDPGGREDRLPRPIPACAIFLVHDLVGARRDSRASLR